MRGAPSPSLRRAGCRSHLSLPEASGKRCLVLVRWRGHRSPVGTRSVPLLIGSCCSLLGCTFLLPLISGFVLKFRRLDARVMLVEGIKQT